MDDRAASAVRFDELANMGYPMGHPMDHSYGHPMGHPMDHPGYPAQMGYDYGFMPGTAPPPVWQNQYMEMNGFKGPMSNWQPGISYPLSALAFLLNLRSLVRFFHSVLSSPSIHFFLRSLTGCFPNSSIHPFPTSA